MTYVALLRGINVGGNRKTDMRALKTVFEGVGLADVRTYINSGNVIFDSPEHDPAVIARRLESAIEEAFGFAVPVQLRDAEQIAALVKALPEAWANDERSRCDVLFLSEAVDAADVMDRLTIKEGIDEVVYVTGAVFWRVARSHVTRSGSTRIVGTPLYANMTARNCNTLRKIAAIMGERA